MRTRVTITAAKAVLAAALVSAPAAASAQLVADAAGDLRANYTGPQGDDLDILGANVFFDGSTFRFVSQSAGDIGTTPGALFVWGMNRGLGTARFGAIAPGVLFDGVVLINPGAGTVTVNDFVNATSKPAGTVSFAGGTLRAAVDATFLPALAGGFDPSRFTFNLWPRVGVGNNDAQIADFAPDNSNLAVVTPEPATTTLLAAGVGLLVAAARRRRTS